MRPLAATNARHAARHGAGIVLSCRRIPMRALLFGVLAAALLAGSAHACRAPASQSNSPALGSGIEEALKEVTLSRRDAHRLDKLRREMARLAAVQEIDMARE